MVTETTPEPFLKRRIHVPFEAGVILGQPALPLFRRPELDHYCCCCLVHGRKNVDLQISILLT